MFTESQHDIIEIEEKLPVPAIIEGSFGYYYIDLVKILFLESSNNTTIIHLEGEKPITVTKVLKYFEHELLGKPFARVHNSYIINVHKLVKYYKGTRKHVILTNGQIIDVSRSRKNVLENNHIAKYSIPVYDGLFYVDLKSVLYLEADHEKTIFNLINGQIITSTKNIGFFKESLTDKPFVRIHDKYVINLLHVTKYFRGYNKKTDQKGKTSGYIVLNTGKGLPVSAGKKESVLRFFHS